MTHVYKSTFGRWYALVTLEGQTQELSFDHEPSEAEISAVMLTLAAPKEAETVVEVEAEDGTIL